MLDRQTRKRWRPVQGCPVQTYRRKGSEYQLRLLEGSIPKPHGRRPIYRWHLYKGSHEVLEVLPYSGLEIAIEQAEDWIADTEE